MSLFVYRAVTSRPVCVRACVAATYLQLSRYQNKKKNVKENSTKCTSKKSQQAQSTRLHTNNPHIWHSTSQCTSLPSGDITCLPTGTSFFLKKKKTLSPFTFILFIFTLLWCLYSGTLC